MVLTAIVVFDIDGVVRDVGGSYRRALADTVEQFTQGAYRPSQADIDRLKSEGLWNNDWEASREMIDRYAEAEGKPRTSLSVDYEAVVDFFQRRYRGENLENPEQWTGYIVDEPLLLSPAYLERLTEAGMSWGFFSGATRGSARFVLEKRLALQSPVLVAMEDAPGKPDPTGLFQVTQQLTASEEMPVIYVGDTVADMQTVQNARSQLPHRLWIGVGILPPHTQHSQEYQDAYIAQLQTSGAAIVLSNVEQLTPERIRQLL
ncbi:MAG: TIGR01548 family HAD-type hydrolase [Leptolyngbyaceae cyanobacterium CRU_2_3]|nr:TIGR01548 family HAD-type hydrolase [Leptolyngbyaceae cyanobacterium CRU_2_3]